MENGKCVWVEVWRGQSVWKTDCGHEIEDNYTSSSWKFCPWCGKVIGSPNE